MRSDRHALLCRSVPYPADREAGLPGARWPMHSEPAVRTRRDLPATLSVLHVHDADPHTNPHPNRKRYAHGDVDTEGNRQRHTVDDISACPTERNGNGHDSCNDHPTSDDQPTCNDHSACNADPVRRRLRWEHEGHRERADHSRRYRARQRGAVGVSARHSGWRSGGYRDDHSRGRQRIERVRDELISIHRRPD